MSDICELRAKVVDDPGGFCIMLSAINVVEAADMLLVGIRLIRV